MKDSLYEKHKDQINVGIISHIYPPSRPGIQSRREIIDLLQSDSYATLTFSDKAGRELCTWVCSVDQCAALESWIRGEGMYDAYHDVVRVDTIIHTPTSITHRALVRRDRTVTEWVPG